MMPSHFIVRAALVLGVLFLITSEVVSFMDMSEAQFATTVASLVQMFSVAAIALLFVFIGAFHGALAIVILLIEVIMYYLTGSRDHWHFFPWFLDTPLIPMPIVIGWWVGYVGSLILTNVFTGAWIFSLAKPAPRVARDAS